MGAVYKEKIRRFDGGLSDDPRDPNLTQSSLVKHFDIYSNPYKLIPIRSSEADTHDGSSSTGMKQYDPQDFLLGTDGKLYALGKNGSSQSKIVSKADPTTGNWTLPASSEGNGARITGSFIEWASALWFFQGTVQVAKWTLAGTLTDTVASVGSTIVTVAPPIIGPDNNLYMFYNNKVVRVSPAGAVTDDVCSAIPADMRISSVSRYGSYLAIGCAYGTSATATPGGRSQVYIWDMVTDTTVEDVLDWGNGSLNILGNVEGRLVGVSDEFLSSSLGQSRGSMVIRLWSGGIPFVWKKVVANQSVTLGRFIRNKVERDGKLYWVASVPFGLSTSTESTFHLGIWCFGRKNVDTNFALSIEIIEEAIDTSNFKINSFGAAGAYFFINHSADGSVVKTDDADNYTETSIYDTPILNGSENGLDNSDTKKLIGVKLFFDALPSAGVVKLFYRKDEQTTFTRIFTYGTDNAISHAANQVEIGSDTVTMTIASPAVVTLTNHDFVAGQAIRFRTTGALPTGVTAGTTYYVKSTGLATDTFQFSATSGTDGTAVNTSGSQSGTHTLERDANLPEYKELVLRLESTGKAVITGILWKYEYIDKDIF